MASSAVLLFAILFISASQAYRVEVEPDAQPHIVPDHFYMAGKPDAEREMSLYIGLTPSNEKELTETLHDIANPSSPRYGKWWTKQEVDKFVAPAPENEQKVLSWLISENVISEKEKAQFEFEGLEKLVRRSVLFWELRCTVAEAERLLAVNFFNFRDTEKDEGVIVRTTQKYTVPVEVASAITIIGNVFRFPSNLAVHASVKKEQSPEGLAITPDVLVARYNVTVPPTNARNIQAVASFLDQYYSDSDTQLFSDDYFDGIDCSITRAVGDNNQSSPGLEAALDTQYIQFGSCSVTTWDYYTAGESDLGNEPFLKWLIGVDAECASGTCPYVYSMSYGDYENTITDAYAASVDFEFQIISLTGRTFLAASGDDGVGCTDLGYGSDYYNCSYYNSIFISTSPHVISVGATTTSSLERSAGFSGGGFSDKFSRPTYQGTAVENYFTQGVDVPPTSFYNKFGRGFPDVGVTGVDFLVYFKGNKVPVDGTSASTPAMAQMISMMNSERLTANLPTLGFANPFLYSAWAASPTAFVDVTDGSAQAHGCCPSGFTPVAGWEPFCGLGAPDYGVLVDMALSPSFIPSFRK